MLLCLCVKDGNGGMDRGKWNDFGKFEGVEDEDVIVF